MNAGRVLFVGCGPGAADLLTLRAVEAIERADIVIWSPSLIDRRVLVERMRPGLATPAAALLLVDAAALADDGDGAGVIAVHGASAAPRALQHDLLRRGLPPSTPCVVALEVSRCDETLLSCALEELAETLEDMALGVLGLVLAGVPATADGRAAKS